MRSIIRIIGLDRHIKSFYVLSSVLRQVSTVLTAAGIVSFVVWVGGASLFYYAELGGQQRYNDEDIVVFSSIPEALYYCAMFLVGDWEVLDFTPMGSVLCVILSVFGVAIVAVPVGILFEGYQNIISEK